MNHDGIIAIRLPEKGKLAAGGEVYPRIAPTGLTRSYAKH